MRDGTPTKTVVPFGETKINQKMYNYQMMVVLQPHLLLNHQFICKVDMSMRWYYVN